MQADAVVQPVRLDGAPPLTHLGRLYFLHIPKTAGTSLRLWLDSLFDVEHCYPHYHAYEVPPDPLAELARHRFFTGHQEWYFAEQYASALGLTIICFLRRPVDRSLSEVRYLRALTPEQTALYRDRTWVRGWVVDLLDREPDEAIVAMPRFREEMGDVQVRQLGLTRQLAFPTSGRPDDPVGLADDGVLAKALDHLGSMASFGLVEDMERSVLLLADALGLPARAMTERANVTADGAERPPAVIERALRAANSHDEQLYAAAMALFESRWATLLGRFGLADTCEGRAALAAALDRRFRLTDRGLGRLSRLTADMSRGMAVDGWKPRFHYPPLNRWLRWSDAPRPRVWLPLDRSAPRTLRADIAYASNVATRDGVTVEIDGQVVPVSRSYEIWPEDGGHHLILAASVPSETEASQYAEVAFRLPSEGAGAIALSRLEVS